MSTHVRTDAWTATGTALAERSFAAVLFDMDGTLISSVASVERGWARLAGELDVPPLDFAELHGIPARDLIERLLPDHPTADRERALARVIAIEMDDTADIEVLPGAEAALTALAGSGRSAIVTSCSGDLAAARLRAAGLVAPDVVVSADDVRRGKPDPEPFRTGAERLGVDPRHCLVVEDAAAGIASGRAAGAAVLALTTTTAGHPGHRPLDGDLVVPDLAAIRFVAQPDGVRLEPV